jgi:hypothetical protein
VADSFSVSYNLRWNISSLAVDGGFTKGDLPAEKRIFFLDNLLVFLSSFTKTTPPLMPYPPLEH